MDGHQELGDAPIDVVVGGDTSAGNGQAGVVRVHLDHGPRIVGDPTHMVKVHARHGAGEVLCDVEVLVLGLVEGQVCEGEVRRVDAALHSLHPVAVLPFFGDVAVRGWHQRHLQRRQLRGALGRPHVGPDHSALLARRIGFDADLVLGVEVGIGGGHVDAASLHVELPAVVDAANTARLVAPEPEVGAAVRAMLIDDADAPARVSERQQLLAHDRDFLGHPVGFGQLLRQQNRQPEAAQQLAHRRSRTGFGQEFIVLCTEHGGPPDYCFEQAWRRSRGPSTWSRLASRRWLEFPMRVRDLVAQKRPSCSANPSRPRAWGMPGARCTRSLACKK